MKGSLTKKQQIVYDYILNALKESSVPPSVREICAGINLKSPATIQNHLVQLEKKGYISRDKNKNRSIRLVDEARRIESTINIPIVGCITAGEPILAVENIEDTFPIPLSYASNKEMFMLRISGSSMIGAGIKDGDLVLVEKQNYANDKDIVVALIEDSATVKTYYNDNGTIRLQPENDLYEPIITKKINIQGKVIGLFRIFNKK